MMFNFFKKKIIEEHEEQNSNPDEDFIEDKVVTISYHTDAEGDIWIDCFWSGEKEGSHLQFAELLEKISNGDLLGDTMEFVAAKCTTPEKKAAYSQIVETVMNLQQMRLFKMMTGMNQSGLTPDDDPVISPTNVIKTGK
jgi:hypothetical protein